jgi:hypothetical protein
MPRAREDGTGEEMRNALFGKRLGRRTVHLHGLEAGSEKTHPLLRQRQTDQTRQTDSFREDKIR